MEIKGNQSKNERFSLVSKSFIARNDFRHTNFIDLLFYNPSIGIVLCKEMDKTYAEYMVRQYDKPLGVATYKTTADMPERLRKTLPNIEA